MPKRFIILGFAIGFFTLTTLFSQENKGCISEKMLVDLQKSFQNTASDKAILNAIANNDINKLALNLSNSDLNDTYFSHKVKTKGITNQKSSGRCWMFSGMNILRAKFIAKYNPDKFEFSQNYLFFWDQLEKSNLFLQAVIDTRNKDFNDKTVEWLFKNPIGDGGQFTGMIDLVTKYGLVPKEAMPETNSSENTTRMTNLISLKLREYGLELREKAAQKEMKEDALILRKTEMLTNIYRMLALNLGVPPTTFTWTLKDANGIPVSTKEYTPKSFYQEFVNEDLSTYIMFMNDPTREYYKVYEIEYDRHMYDGLNWKYINLPIDDIKEMAMQSIKDSTALYFSCDVGKYYNRDNGTLDLNNFDYESLMGITFGMNKKQRIQSFASSSSHAMTLCGVDINKNGKPLKWLLENSWGLTGYNGYLIMTDDWFNEYMFRLVVEQKYVKKEILDLLKTESVKLPPWDPMFALEE
ncbi:MAG: Aminopeptidase C [Bacteroidetes bacterium ADurb.Bin234]|nr:MAG: Aminopeptidase C [Bacteroidetes bacterium ADurb.Bin234]